MVVTDPVEMAQAIFGAFPDLTGRPVTVHDGGWDSVGIEIDRTWMFKFPRDADGLEALRLETAVLDAVRPYVTISVPEMIVVDQPILFTRHRMLPGSALSNADYLRLSEDDRTRLAGAVGGFLAEVHGINADWSQIGVESDDDILSMSDIADAAMPVLVPELRAAAERVLAEFDTLGEDPLGCGFCYLDAHGRNFAFDHATGRLNGIFDFGDAAIAPRHAEFVEPAYVSRDFALRVIGDYTGRTGRTIDVARVETLIGVQRLIELGEDADDPKHGDAVRAYARDWFAAPTLDAPAR